MFVKCIPFFSIDSVSKFR